MKVLEIVRFYSLEEIKEYVNKGNKYPKHHLWCYDKISDAGNEINEIKYNTDSFINKIGKFIGIPNADQQLKALKNIKNYDIIFSPWVTDVSIIVFLKYLGIIQKPILGLAHTTFKINKTNIIKYIYTKTRRNIFLRGTDRILFFTEKTFKKDLEYGNIHYNHSFIKSWGVDLDFFDDYKRSQCSPPLNDVIFSTGGTNRDFKILTDCFVNNNFKLEIITKYVPDYMNSKSSNIVINNSIKPGLDSAYKLLPHYYNAYAFAIPLKNKLEMCTGLTVLLEAMAMGKPVISTKNEYYSFDIEKEKIGLVTEFNDPESWEKAIDYLITHPIEAGEFGQNGLALCRSKYNYDLFSEEIINELKMMILEK